MASCLLWFTEGAPVALIVTENVTLTHGLSNSGSIAPTHHNMNVFLLTEDLADHALFQEVLNSLNGNRTFTGCTSFADVCAKLASSDVLLPSLIFVSMKLSRTYDNELFHILKSNVDLSPAPVIVFADSVAQEEVLATYSLPVSCLVVFPGDRELRKWKIGACLEFWSKCAELPQLHRWCRDS